MAPKAVDGDKFERMQTMRMGNEKKKHNVEENLRKQLFALRPDIQTMEKALQEGEMYLSEDPAHAQLLADVKKKLDTLKAAWAKKMEAERQKELAKKREDLSAKLEQLGSMPLLDMDLAEYSSTLNELVNMEVPKDLSSVEKVNTIAQNAKNVLTEARELQTARRLAAETELESQMTATLLTVDAAALRKAYDDAAAAGVDKAALVPAQARLAQAQQRDVAKAKLEEAASAPPEGLDIGGLRAAWLGAVSVGASATLLETSLATLGAALESQAGRSLAAARLEGLLEHTPEATDTGALRAVKLEASEAGVASELLVMADKLLERAEQAQMRANAATTCLLALAAPREPNAADVSKLTELLPKAEGAGVSADVVELCRASLDEAKAAIAACTKQDAEGGSVVDAHAAHIHRLEAANKRTAARAPQKQEEAAKALEMAEAAELGAVEASAAATSEAEAAFEALKQSIKALADVDAKIASETGRTYAESEEARGKVSEAEAALQEKRAVAQAAKVAEATASWSTRKAMGNVEWAQQVATAVANASKKPAATRQPSFKKAVSKQASRRMSGGGGGGGGGGGCCGGGDPPVDPVAVKVNVETKGGGGGGGGEAKKKAAPLPRLVDELAWAPLTLPTGSKHQIELLLAFAVEGVYVDPDIAESVATAVCASDPNCVTSGALVLQLAEACAKGSAVLTAGGLPLDRANSRGKERQKRGSVAIVMGAITDALGFSPEKAARPSMGGMPDLSREWPGRQVSVAIEDPEVKLLLQSWLVRMARAGGKGLSRTLTQLMRPPHAALIKRVGVQLAPILEGLLLRHFEAVAEAERAAANKPASATGGVDGGDGEEEDDDEAAVAAAAALADVHCCIELLLGAGEATMKDLLPVWTKALKDGEEKTKMSPSTALAGTARAFSASLFAHEPKYKPTASGGGEGAAAAENAHFEAVILALVALFVASPGKLTGLQQIVPKVFDVYLALKTPLRLQLCSMLKDGGMEESLVKRIETDDELVRQIFFWSEAGMKLFGRHPDIQDKEKLRALLATALESQPIIVSAFLDDQIAQANKDKSQVGNLGQLAGTCTAALLVYVGQQVTEQEGSGGEAAPILKKGVLSIVENVLVLCARHHSSVYPLVLEALEASDHSTLLLQSFVDSRRNRLVNNKKDDGDAAEELSAEDLGKDEALLQSLVNLFAADPTKLGAFASLTPALFESRLVLGTPIRHRFNEVLLSTDFDPNFAHLLEDTDEIVRAPFFWNDQVMPLCTRARIDKSYSSLSKAHAKDKDGHDIHLYERLLALLLRLSAKRGGENKEIAKRTIEVLDQFERNPDQQTFVLSILETLDERSISDAEAFAEIPLTVLSEVAANGVQTITSVQGEGMQLCEHAMTTLLSTYIRERKPSEWKGLFKDATNIAFMVKYMFRENLGIAKEKFTAAVGTKKGRGSAEEVEVVQRLVDETLQAYGNVGIYDTEELAEIDFLNHPEQLVELVTRSKGRKSRLEKPDMILLTDITTKWMQLMVDKKYPPLTPHHTQAFTVLMMAKFFTDFLQGDPQGAAALGKGGKASKNAVKYKTFVAQLSTGEGKSIVIAMCAIFMVKLFGMKVHVLENNAGLMERDYQQNKPFYDKFGITSGTSLDEDEVPDIVYCLKQTISRRFLRKMVEGKLEDELSKTVLIVDEVDDLIVNEKPNAHFVKKDAQKTPALVKSYEALKKGGQSATQPDGVDDETWAKALRVVAAADAKELDVHYRKITDEKGQDKLLQLDKDGNVPKVRLTSPWLTYLDYKLCGVEPFAETHYACVCTPYVFNKYKGIFGLTGSVGGKAELNYLAKTYKALKFDVPRFLDTCIGNARKEVKNHGVELHNGQPAIIKRTVELAVEYFRKVPVLIITTGPEQMTAIIHALQDADEIPADEVQRFSQFDEKGKSMSDQWQSVVDDATKRLGGNEDNRCRVTVTDKFGGRGHDFQVVDKEANANGGMLVIATSIPDEREWIQWKGRTARQDRPGQFYVLLDESSPPFTDGAHDKLAGKMRSIQKGNLAGADPSKSPADLMVETMLDVSDEGIGEKLKSFESEQATGERLNEMTIKYFKAHPRGFDDPWPREEFMETDVVLRRLLSENIKATPQEVKAAAKKDLGLDID